MDQSTYNGWTNRDTWLVTLWIDNDPVSSSQARQVVADSLEMDKHPSVAADNLRDWVFDEFAVTQNGFEYDLQNYALGQVNWLEIVRTYMERE